MKKIKKSWIVIGVIVILALVGYSSFKGVYNQMAVLDEGIPAQWAQVEKVYQRRADLIPNLVETIKDYATHE